jgi:hypothetical protein
MKSPLAEQARQERLEQERRMTPGHRIQAFMNHSQLMTQLYLAGCAAAKDRSSPERIDAR